jgi:hypothetical protein
MTQINHNLFSHYHIHHKSLFVFTVRTGGLETVRLLLLEKCSEKKMVEEILGTGREENALKRFFRLKKSTNTGNNGKSVVCPLSLVNPLSTYR